MLLSSETVKHIQVNDVDGEGNEIVLYPESTSDDIIVNEMNNRLSQFLTTSTTDLSQNGSAVSILESEDDLVMDDGLMESLYKL